MLKTTSNIESNLNYYDKAEGRIIEKQILNNSSSLAGKSSMNKKVFAFIIEGQVKPFAIYNAKQDYKELDSKVNLSDFLTVYYKENPSDKINKDIIQVEKNKELLYSSKEYVNKERLGGIIAIVGGFVILSLGFKDYIIKKLK
jgi:hypothetical protein